MNEFEWLRQTRSLGGPVPPARDLWPPIARRIETPAAAPRRRRLLPWALAASVGAVALVAGGMAIQQLRNGAPAAAGTGTHPVGALQAAAQAPHWRPDDPRLTGAAIELHAANTELTQAMEQAPQAEFLQHLIDRTRQQQARLRRLENRAG